MSKMRKALFSALAVFAMFTIGALNLSASNVTSEVTESKVEMSAEVLQTPYVGEVYYWDGTVFILVPDVDTSHCSLNGNGDSCMISVDGVGYVELYGINLSNSSKEPLFEII